MQNVGIVYALVALVAAVIRYAGSRIAQHLLQLAAWALHLGCGTILLAREFAPAAMPRHYAYYPKAFVWVIWISNIATFLTLISLAPGGIPVL